MIIKCTEKNIIEEFTNEAAKFILGYSDSVNFEPFAKSCLNRQKVDFKQILADFDNLKPIVKEDLAFFLLGDPAANSEEEIITCYPGFMAILYYRIAHVLASYKIPLVPRIITEISHSSTGIDIHPNAKIGHPFFIDHGTGVVIGETSIIGNRVKVYQGVTIGALSLGKGAALKGIKRHPTIGNNVTIYANASILGGDVIIGDNVIIGGNVYLTKSIPPNTKVLIQEPQLLILSKTNS